MSHILSYLLFGVPVLVGCMLVCWLWIGGWIEERRKRELMALKEHLRQVNLKGAAAAGPAPAFGVPFSQRPAGKWISAALSWQSAIAVLVLIIAVRLLIANAVPHRSSGNATASVSSGLTQTRSAALPARVGSADAFSSIRLALRSAAPLMVAAGGHLTLKCAAPEGGSLLAVSLFQKKSNVETPAGSAPAKAESVDPSVLHPENADPVPPDLFSR